MDKIEAIDIAKRYKQLLKEHIKFEKMYLFGSFAKKTSRKSSDIDVAIVVKKLHGDYFATVPLLWKLRRQVDDRIEPIIIEKNNDKSGFLDEIKKYGIEII